MKLRNIIPLFSITCCCALSAGSLVSARDYVTSDGVLSITIPDNDWLQVESPNAEFTFTNDLNVISLVKYQAGDSVEPIQTSDRFENVFSFSYAHDSYLYVATAYIADSDKAMDVLSVLETITFAEGSGVKPKKPASVFSIHDCTKVMYVNSEGGVNLRENYEVSSKVLAIIDDKTPINVTGIVMQDSFEAGWYQVEYEEQTGYVAASSVCALEELTPISYEEISASLDHYGIAYDELGNVINIIFLTEERIVDFDGYYIIEKDENTLQMIDGTILHYTPVLGTSSDSSSESSETADAQSESPS